MLNAVVLAGAVCFPGLPDEVEVRAVLEKSRVRVGEIVGYHVEVAARRLADVTLDDEALLNLRSLGVMPGSEPSIERRAAELGEPARMVWRFDFQLRPTSPGSFELPRPKVRVEELGEDFLGNAVTLTVAEDLTGSAQLLASVSRLPFFVGERVSLEFELFVAVERWDRNVELILDLGPLRTASRVEGAPLASPEPPRFWVAAPSGPRIPIAVELQGRRWRLRGMLWFTLAEVGGLRSGSISIRPPSDQWIAVSEPFTLVSQELPRDQPAHFHGAIGRFELETSLEVGPESELAALRVNVTGDGWIETAQMPDVRQLTDFEVLRREDREGTSEFYLRPRNPGITELPGLIWSCFDPQTARFVELRTAPLALPARSQAAGPAEVGAEGLPGPAPEPWRTLTLAMLVLVAGTELLARSRAPVAASTAVEISPGRELLATTEDGAEFLSAWLREVERCQGIEPGTLGAASVAEVRALVNLEASRWTEFRAVHAQVEAAVYGSRVQVDSFRQRAIDLLGMLDPGSSV